MPALCGHPPSAPAATPADTNRLINADAIDEHTLEPVVKFLLVAGAIFLLWGLVSALPGIDLLIPTTSIILGTAIGAVLTLALVAAIALGDGGLVVHHQFWRARQERIRTEADAFGDRFDDRG